ncbi:MAG: hypothetical protein IKZ47_05765 [Clostridia bacterium]|nr:hypothetical protein [Clostridia bacterium]
MADKKENVSETISQQRKAREEYLELKRMQNGELEPPPPPSSEVVLPKTFKEKVKNYWYFYRWIVIGSVFTAVVIAICVAQCMARVKPDIYLTVYAQEYISDADAEKISEYFQKYCEDVNNDGKTYVEINNCSYATDGNPQVIVAKKDKFNATFVAEETAFLYILDRKTFESFKDIATYSKAFEEKTVTLGDDFYNYCDSDDGVPLPKGLKLYMRIVSKPKNKTVAQYKSAAEKVFNEIAQHNG